MTPEGVDPRRSSALELLVCPPEQLLEDFVARPGLLDATLLRAVSRHLARCLACREETDRRRRRIEAWRSQRPWPAALIAGVVLATAAGAFVHHEISLPPPEVRALRPDPRLAALARFDPPGDAALAALGLTDAERPAGGGRAGGVTRLSVDDRRELAAARASLEAGRVDAAAGLLEDLVVRHPRHPGLRLLAGYVCARAGEFERARRHYAAADERGAGIEACRGIVGACLRLGDVAGARRELSAHVLARRPDDDEARELLARLGGPEDRMDR